MTSDPGARRCPCCDGELTGRPLSGSDRNHGLPGDFEVLRCGVCGTGATRPFVPEDRLGDLYPGEYAPYDLPVGGLAGLASRVIRRWQAFRAMRTAPFRALTGRPPGTVADVGCGRGDLGSTFAARGWAVTGIEPSPDACAVAGERGIDAREGTLATVQLEPGGYDAVTFMHSLEHVSDSLEALQTVRAALKPGGLCLISVPNFGGWQARRFGSRWFHLDLPRHRTHFTPEGAVRVLERAGLEALAVSTSSSNAGLLGSVQYALFGRCLFPSGLSLRAALAVCWAFHPLSRLLDRAGGGDVLDVVARRPA